MHVIVSCVFSNGIVCFTMFTSVFYCYELCIMVCFAKMMYLCDSCVVSNDVACLNRCCTLSLCVVHSVCLMCCVD